MGTYYTLGIVRSFTASSYKAIPETEWKNCLNDRLDIEQYSLNVQDKIVKGSLKDNIFEENIEDFYMKLVDMTGDDRVLDWFDLFKSNMDKYYSLDTNMKITHKDIHITLTSDIAMLFIEGKVMVEQFTIEPKLMNSLFRHADLSNKLAGCVMSGVTG